jgi:hypothetical protein
MHKEFLMTASLTSLSGADLRALVAAGDAAAVAELARRIAKREASGKVTVAALRSWGRTDEAAKVVDAAKAAKAAAKPTPVAKVVLTRTTEVAVPKAKALTLTQRMGGIEAGLASLAGAINSQNLVLGELVRALSK